AIMKPGSVMDPAPMKSRQLTLRKHLLVVAALGIFCAGYRLGYSSGRRDARLDALVTLISETIRPSSGWLVDTVDTTQSDDGSALLPVAEADSPSPEIVDPDRRERDMDSVTGQPGAAHG